MSNRVHPVEILLVEDNPGDIVLTQEAMAEARVKNHMSVARDGEEALRFLRREGDFGDAPRPDLILLDLNLPRKDGREVLEEIKSDPKFRRIPVIVLTTSSSEADVLQTYDLHANGYVTKPLDVADFLAAIRQIEGFWLEVVRLPKE